MTGRYMYLVTGGGRRDRRHYHGLEAAIDLLTRYSGPAEVRTLVHGAAAWLADRQEILGMSAYRAGVELEVRRRRLLVEAES